MIKLIDIIRNSSSTDENPLYNDDRDGVLLSLFSDIPDYADDEINALWEKMFFSDKKKVISFCREKGIDILDDKGKIIPVGYDVAVMLKQGFLPE